MNTCGCTDYHLADCPLRTGGGTMTARDIEALMGRPDYDPYYDDPA